MTAALLKWRLAIGWALLFSLSSLVSAFLTATATNYFPSLSAWDKTIVFMGVFLNWSNTMMAFLSKASQRVSTGKDLLEVEETTPRTNYVEPSKPWPRGVPDDDQIPKPPQQQTENK